MDRGKRAEAGATAGDGGRQGWEWRLSQGPRLVGTGPAARVPGSGAESWMRGQQPGPRPGAEVGGAPSSPSVEAGPGTSCAPLNVPPHPPWGHTPQSGDL